MENLYDSHVHINLNQYDKNREKIIKMCENKLDFMINIGIDEKSSEQSIAYSFQYDFIYATVGVHPTNIKEYTDKLEKRLFKMGKEEKVVAIGEIGLDYHWMKDPKDYQKEIFRRQMEIARKLNKPVVIHSREAQDDTFKILEEFSNEVYGVMHTYAGDIETMKKLKNMGYYFSFSGPVTFKGKRSDYTRKVVKNTPIERILIETDSPFLAPQPMRGKVNVPTNVEYVFEKIAEIKNMSKEKALFILRNNAKEIFGI
ncbi:MAG: TatD family deoxyribonuclease [Candidatus Mcinerneyibacterium aminivorans]|uniref:TatD family deoxyribonuclease n=1 Tax=Candidatus Mcinerneyibacterium aminivorans TaxID=2703815 RepID=A0A5D0MFF8_9BACT|nr:MAG: TatD family deoxyribonuclease [Candidatus Mcinerneyibacterium aminivorans]